MNLKYLTEKYPYLTLQGEETTVGNYCLVDSGPWGLFSCFYCILYGIYICEEEGLTPVVKMGDNHLYYSSTYGENVFTYFYEQDGSLKTDDMPKITLSNPSGFLSTWSISVSEKKLASVLLNKYFVLIGEFRSIIDKFCAGNFLQHRVLGVHYRGRDKIKEAAILHFSEYLKKIDYLLDNNICDKIFFATDELDLRDYMNNRYGGKVCTYILEGNYGSSQDLYQEGLHFLPGGSHYLQARDAVMECYLLANCHMLLSSRKSSLSLFATYINPEIIHLIIEP